MHHPQQALPAEEMCAVRGRELWPKTVHILSELSVPVHESAQPQAAPGALQGCAERPEEEGGPRHEVWRVSGCPGVQRKEKRCVQRCTKLK